MKVQGLLLVVIFYLAYAQLVNGQTLPDCQTKCGNITLEYPFGTSPGCYYDQCHNFNLTCNETKNLLFGDIPVNSISLSDGKLRVQLFRSKVCYDSEGSQTDLGISTSTLADLTLSTKNKITVVGCNSYAFLEIEGFGDYSSGCLSICDSVPSGNGSCSGEGCCQTSIPRGSSFATIKPGSFNNHTKVNDFNPCTYAFLVENDKFQFHPSEDLLDLRNVRMFHVVLDWFIGSKTCIQLDDRDKICGGNTTCKDSIRGKGYICQCVEGFDGNPYLLKGCEDINECTSATVRHNCSKPSTCENTKGSFNCKCQADI